MGDAYPIRTLGDYSKPRHEGYRNTIELHEGNNMVPFRSDTICMDSFQGLTPKSPSSWHRSLAPSPNFYDHFNPVTRRTIDQLVGGKLRDRNTKESWALLKDLALYDNKSWNDPRDFAKPAKAISLPQDVPSTFDRRLIELKNQVQRLMKAYIAPMQPTQVNKITSSCEICSGSYDTQYCMENPKQAFVEYASSCTDEAGGKWYTFKPEQNNLGDTYNPSWRSHPNLRLPKFEVNFKQQQSEMTNKIDTVLKAITDRIAGALPSDTVKNPNLNVNSITLVLSARSYPMEDPPMLIPNPQFDQCRNFTCVIDFIIVEDISSIIDPRLSQVVLGKPFVEISNMTHDPPEGVVRNEKDKRRGVEYVMSKILGFYKECLELKPEYLTGVADEDEVTLYLMRKSLKVLRKFHWTTLGGRSNHLSHVSSPILSKPGEY
uniref:MAK10-like protein n=1 Tax=Tanacetum cinerariifolium TaxID=118510 RepID=A0A6L2KAM6_TANCI|nr:MAK10-like protein [Tanacetum cinerariifolium]